MKLTDSEKSKISSNYTSLYGVANVKCPICKNEHFTIGEEAFMLQLEGVLDRWVRLAVVHCDKCNHVDLFALPPKQG